MDINLIRWTYAIAKPGPDKELEAEYSTGPMEPNRIRLILGGDYAIQSLLDSTAIAYLRDQDNPSLEDNLHYPGIRGPILVGKMSGSSFVGALGIAL